MIQLIVELTVVMFFVIAVFVSSISVPVYAFTARGRWGWLAVFIVATFAWVWGMHWFAHAHSAELPVQLTPAEVWWNQYWWHVAVVFYQVIGISLGLVTRRQGSASAVFIVPVVVASTVVGVASVVMVQIAPQYLGQDVLSFMQAQMTQTVQQTLALAKDIPADQQAMLQTLGSQSLMTSLKVMPAMIWLVGLGVSALTLFLGKWFVPRPVWMKYQGGLTRWKMRGICVWLAICLGAVYCANQYGLPVQRLMPVVWNGLLILAGLFLLQGVMITTYYIRRQREGVFRWMWIVLIALFFQTAVVVMTVLGIFDYWADFRRIDRKIIM